MFASQLRLSSKHNWGENYAGIDDLANLAFRESKDEQKGK